MKLKHWMAVAIALASTAGTFSVTQAATDIATFNVTLTIEPQCVFNAANDLDFGSTQGVFTSEIDQTTRMQVTCTNTTPYNVGIDPGTVQNSSTTTRLMQGTTAGNTSTVSFHIYQDAAHTKNWGNQPGTDTVGGTGNGSVQNIDVYGVVPVQASAPIPDTYKTTLTATVYF